MIDIPYGTEFNGLNSDPDPCTHNGFLGGRNDTIVPEWYVGDYTKANVQKGAQIFKVVNGVKELLGVFEGGRFIPIN